MDHICYSDLKSKVYFRLILKLAITQGLSNPDPPDGLLYGAIWKLFGKRAATFKEYLAGDWTICSPSQIASTLRRYCCFLPAPHRTVIGACAGSPDTYAILEGRRDGYVLWCRGSPDTTRTQLPRDVNTNRVGRKGQSPRTWEERLGQNVMLRVAVLRQVD